MSETGKLKLGWRIDDDWNPAYWQKDDTRVPGHSPADLVTVPAALAARHGIIVAQSGSGKSFFLGRLIEEILLRTRARVVVLDPNADFRAVHDLRSIDHMIDRQYPTENEDTYADEWKNISKAVFRLGEFDPVETVRQFQLWWPNVSVDVISQDLNSAERAEFQHCHRFVREIASGVDDSESRAKPPGLNEILDHSERLFFTAKDQEVAGGEAFLDTLIENILEFVPFRSHRRDQIKLNRALASLKYVSTQTGRLYFSRVRHFQLAGILSDASHTDDYANRRLTVVDLPSLPDLETRYLAVSSTLNLVWRYARAEWEAALLNRAEDDRRVPTFIILDEAHHMIPSDLT